MDKIKYYSRLYNTVVNGNESNIGTLLRQYLCKKEDEKEIISSFKALSQDKKDNFINCLDSCVKGNPNYPYQNLNVSENLIDNYMGGYITRISKKTIPLLFGAATILSFYCSIKYDAWILTMGPNMISLIGFFESSEENSDFNKIRKSQKYCISKYVDEFSNKLKNA